MKTIKLKSVKLAPDAPQDTSYADLIRAVLACPPDHGFQLEEMRKRSRVLDALEATRKDATDLHLEDADHDTLVRCVEAMRWGIFSPAIIAFADDIKGAA